MKGVSKILAAAVAGLAILPAASQAASVVLSYANLAYDADGDFSAGSTSVPIVAGSATLPIPAGQFVKFDIVAQVVGDTNPAAAGTYSSGTHVQPAVLGLAAFGGQLSTSNAARLKPTDAGGVSTASVNTVFSSVSNPGTISLGGSSIGDVSVPATLLAGGFNSANVDAAATGATGNGVPGLVIGNTPITIAADIFFQTSSAANGGNLASSIVANFPSSSIAFVSNQVVGSAPVTKSKYINRNFVQGSDTMTGPGTLLLNNVPEPTSLAVLGLAGAGLMARRRKA